MAGPLHTINSANFESVSLSLFREQYERIGAYREFCDLLHRTPHTVRSLEEIPFLPVEFFKTHELKPQGIPTQTIFRSSGTTGQDRSQHLVTDLEIYRESFRLGFEHFYGNPANYCIVALLPSYAERPDSSLIFMVDELMRMSGNPKSGYLGGTTEEIIRKLTTLDKGTEPVLLIGVSFALLDIAETHRLKLERTIIMETGGMKGRRKEIVREDLHAILCKGFGVERIHSEYGMTELLSQGYSKGDGRFRTPPWMRVLFRDTEDPFHYIPQRKTGGINVIDLANRNSCAFLATQDLGKGFADGSFEVLGRFDHSDVRGCNLLVL
ncbi:hypothetical protein SAMN04490243_1418 [Robiginitalea myxolifaciens]|uniref:Acyl-protein synthetase, LuxE n=1 Tax=Robiginitalea myxolifaciens TaxID=400055 RepID=A0A1I6G8Y0_9FLAO|nr:acyl transferase [Robiginitalea myxolifaciens]SFR38638.1 hypothetical protein SAMN04490243_1418 [Robiginitalea myxolifaciens]